MKLVLYSGGDRLKNHRVNLRLLDLLKTRNLRITYIPSASDEERKYFKEFKDWFGFYGFKNLNYFDLGNEYSLESANQALNSKVIYLSGGNTYNFLYWLRKRGFLNSLRNFVENEGILIGLSAGSILMTPSISTSGIPSYDHDENLINLKNLKALNLVNFEFFPHYSPSKRLDEEILSYSKKSLYPTFGVKEGNGIIIWGGKMELVGSPHIFYKGNKVNLY